MLLASDDKSYKSEFNIDDKLGERVDIPSMIVSKEVGDILKEYVTKSGREKVVISVKFSAVKEEGIIEIDLFFRSDDFKALHFFKEFEGYYKKLSKYLPIFILTT
jgi:hypothetical protein